MNVRTVRFGDMQDIASAQYSERELQGILARVLSRYSAHISAFANRRLRPEMHEEFAEKLTDRLWSAIRRRKAPFDDPLVDGRIDWDAHGPRIYGFLRAGMEFERRSIFKKRFEDLERRSTSLRGNSETSPEPDASGEEDAYAPMGEAGEFGSEFIEQVPDESIVDIEEALDAQRFSQSIPALEEVLTFLVADAVIKDREARVLLLRVRDELTLEQIGHAIGKTKSTAERDYNAAMKAIGDPVVLDRIRRHFKGRQPASHPNAITTNTEFLGASPPSVPLPHERIKNDQ